MKTELIDIGNRIRECIDKSDMNATQVAEKIGVLPHAVSRWQCASRLPSTEHLIELARVLDASLDYIVFGKEAEDENSGDMGAQEDTAELQQPQ